MATGKDNLDTIINIFFMITTFMPPTCTPFLWGKQLFTHICVQVQERLEVSSCRSRPRWGAFEGLTVNVELCKDRQFQQCTENALFLKKIRGPWPLWVPPLDLPLVSNTGPSCISDTAYNIFCYRDLCTVVSLIDCAKLK